MSRNKKRFAVSSVAQSLLMGAGSILGLAGAEFNPYSHSPMARQDRDTRSIRSDWQQVGKDLRSGMDKERRNRLSKIN